MQNTHGGFDTGFVGSGPLGVTVTVDTEKLCGHEGGTFFFDWEFNHWYNGTFPPGGTFDPTGSYVGVNTNFMDSDVARAQPDGAALLRTVLADDGALVAFGKMDANVRSPRRWRPARFRTASPCTRRRSTGSFPTYPNESTALVGTFGDPEVLRRASAGSMARLPRIDPATGETGPDTGPRGRELSSTTTTIGGSSRSSIAVGNSIRRGRARQGPARGCRPAARRRARSDTLAPTRRASRTCPAATFSGSKCFGRRAPRSPTTAAASPTSASSAGATRTRTRSTGR